MESINSDKHLGAACFSTHGPGTLKLQPDDRKETAIVYQTGRQTPHTA